jgi:hypothetical protein
MVSRRNLNGDKEALASLDKKILFVRDRVNAVIDGYQTGFYLWGTGGLGKSYSVLKTLEERECDHHLFNSRITAKGLFLALEASPDAIHVLEDVERLIKDPDAQGVLRSALWSQKGRDRLVTWTTAEGSRRTVFRGGIIMISNRKMDALPELQALATRIDVLKLEVSEAEMAAHMRRIAGQGLNRNGRVLESSKCMEVCEFLIKKCQKEYCPLDLRLMDNSFRDYLQWDANHTKFNWKDLVTARVKQRASDFEHGVNVMSRSERLDGDRQVVREIIEAANDPQEQVRLWEARTGRGKATFYARKREVQSGEFEVA